MKEAFIFGRGRLYKQKEAYISKNFVIKGFLDNSIDVEDKNNNGDISIPVYHPKDIDWDLNENILVVLMSYQYVEMWEQLNEFGVRKEQIVFGIMFPPMLDGEKLLFEDDGRLSIDNLGTIYYLNNSRRIKVENHRHLQETVKEKLREQYREKYPIINAISDMGVIPVSTGFGLERGKAIDRYYIEHFLEKNKDVIQGDCIEIAENTYTLRYGKNRVKNAYILHVKGWGEKAIKGNLETGEGILEDQYDCAIITQTLMFIFDIRKVAENIYKMLKEGGNALITVAGISQISHYDANLWGSYYGFHEDAMKVLFEPLFGKENVKIETYGNVKTAVAMLCGLCQEDLKEGDFSYNDSDYPVIITALVHKSSGRKLSY